MNGQRIRVLFDLCAKAAQNAGDGGQPVAFLQPKPCGTGDDGIAVPQGGTDGQWGHQIRAVPNVQLHWTRLGQLFHIVYHDPIPLNTAGIHACDGYGIADLSGGIVKSCL